MKVIINFGEKKVVVPCGADGELSIRDLIHVATAKFCKLSSYNQPATLNSDQVQLRLNNGAVVDPDDRVCDVVDDREELFAIVDSYQSAYPSHTTTINSNGELSSSITSSNLSSSLSEHDRFIVPSSSSRHEVLVTDADLRTRSLRVKNDPTSHQQQISQPSSSYQEKLAHRSTYSPPTHDASRTHSSNDTDVMHNSSIDEKTGDRIFVVLLPKENSPLGIHVVPSNADEQQVDGLVLQNIEADGRIKRQGILQINDRIIEINRTNIERCSFDRAQLIFRTALLEPELELKVVRSTKKPPRPASLRSQSKTRSTLAEINPNNELPWNDHDSNMNSLNTRRLGKIVKITLTKGNDGLGFKLASRDNPTGAANPIYVKTIFPKGAAIEDGRLQRGDRLLSVNTIDITQMTLQETVGLLRDTRAGDTVELCVSRQRDGLVPQELANEQLVKEIKPQLLTFEIPLNDTSSAGLGITLKGKASLVDGQSVDLGIFVKSILTGGAASRDNRLRPNDQMLIINDSSLVNTSNLEAATILHDAVRREIHPGYIKVTVSRLPTLTDDEQLDSTRFVRETDLTPASLLPMSNNNDDNELDLTTFVPPLIRKPPSQQSNRHSCRLESTRLADADLRSSSPRSLSSSARARTNPSPSRMKRPAPQHPIDQQPQDDVDGSGSNPFGRETPFRQSISEKRRLTHQPNKQAVQWKQRSFHEARTNNERKQPMRALPDTSSNNSNNNNNRPSPNLVRASSFESIHLTTDERQSPKTDDERKRQAKLRNRACNDSFRQAVDKSYGQNVHDEDANPEDKFNKGDKQRFRFANLFTTKPKKKETADERPIKSIVLQHPSSSQDNRMVFYTPTPPPPASFSMRPEFTQSSSLSKASNSQNDRPTNIFSYSTVSSAQQSGYQPYRFESSPILSHEQPPPPPPTDRFQASRYGSQVIHEYPPKPNSGKSSLSFHNQKPSRPPIPRQFLQMNVSGSLI